MTETAEAEKVYAWRKDWLQTGGWSEVNAELLSSLDIDYRYANKVLSDCLRSGHTEEFALNLIT